MNDSAVSITLTDGDTLDYDELVLRGDGISGQANVTDLDTVDGEDEWTTGSSVTFSDDDSEIEWDSGSVNIVWEESGGDGSATLYTFDAPEE